MANYDEWKQKYSTLNDNQRQMWNDKISGMDANSEARQFTERYNQEMNNNQQSNNNSSNFNNQNGTNGQNQQNFDTPTVQKTENQNNNQNNQTYNYDPEEKLDTDMFKQSDGKVVVKEGTAQQTGMPDYQLDSDARTREITDNLNAYWQTNREYFQDRNTYNNMFHYNERSDQQKAVLDSYWKKKEDMNVAERYNTADGIKSGMSDAEITPDQLNYIKEYSPEAYKEWQQKQIDDINLRIANLATPADPTSNAELFNSLLTKLGLEPGDPYQIYDNWYDMAERLGVFSDSEKLKSYQNQLDQNHSKMESIMGRYANSTGGTVSDALAAARMNKALAPYQQREVDLQNSYTTLLNGRNSNLAVANQSAQALAMQAQEDQRVWNQRLQGLGFAMTTASYRSPEQQAQLQLQTAQIQNDMNLLQTSMQNDLNRYNAYATAKMQNQLQNEMFDLSVTDPTELRNNLNNVLSQYYDQYGMMIQRSQQQAVDDILKYAKDNNVSVAEALSQNFIKPLQEKPQYKASLNKTTGYDPYANQQQRQYVMDEDGKVSLKISGYGEIPDDAFESRSSREDAYKDVYNYAGGSWTDYVQCLSDSIKDGSYGGQCGAFVNDVLKAGGADKVFGDSLKQKIEACNEENPQVGYAVVFDFGHKSSDGVNHGHVGIVTKVNNDGSIEVLESNYNGKGQIRTQTYSANTVKSSVKGYYRPDNYTTQPVLQPRENVSSTQNGSVITNQRGSYDKRYADDFAKILTDAEGKTYTDKDKQLLISQIGSEDEYFNQLYAFKMEQESKGSQNALNVLKTIQEFENLGGTDRSWGKIGAWGTALVDEAEYQKFQQLQKQLQLQELFNAKARGATFGAMSQGEWDVLREASNSLKWGQNWGFNAELENIKQALWTAAFNNNNYTPENWQAWKDANPLASESVRSSSNSSNLSNPLTTSTLFGRSNTGYNMNFISNK